MFHQLRQEYLRLLDQLQVVHQHHHKEVHLHHQVKEVHLHHHQAVVGALLHLQVQVQEDQDRLRHEVQELHHLGVQVGVQLVPLLLAYRIDHQ